MRLGVNYLAMDNPCLIKQGLFLCAITFMWINYEH